METYRREDPRRRGETEEVLRRITEWRVNPYEVEEAEEVEGQYQSCGKYRGVRVHEHDTMILWGEGTGSAIKKPELR